MGRTCRHLLALLDPPRLPQGDASGKAVSRFSSWSPYGKKETDALNQLTVTSSPVLCVWTPEHLVGTSPVSWCRGSMCAKTVSHTPQSTSPLAHWHTVPAVPKAGTGKQRLHPHQQESPGEQQCLQPLRMWASCLEVSIFSQHFFLFKNIC